MHIYKFTIQLFTCDRRDCLTLRKTNSEFNERSHITISANLSQLVHDIFPVTLSHVIIIEIRKFIRLRTKSSQAGSTYVLRRSRETYRKAICAGDRKWEFPTTIFSSGEEDIMESAGDIESQGIASALYNTVI